MTEPNNRELNDKIADIREWLVRIDTKVDFFNDVKHTAERAEAKADKALLKSDDQSEDIEALRAEVKAVEARSEKRADASSALAKWAIGLTISSIIAVIGIIANF
jgi:hypothetical protein